MHGEQAARLGHDLKFLFYHERRHDRQAPPRENRQLELREAMGRMRGEEGGNDPSNESGSSRIEKRSCKLCAKESVPILRPPRPAAPLTNGSPGTTNLGILSILDQLDVQRQRAGLPDHLLLACHLALPG
jgi:hypothetical protein